VTFHVQETGAGPPVVLAHGLFFGNLAPWYFYAAPLLAGEHTVFLYDLRGHGKSERVPEGYDLATMTADLAALVERFDGQPIDVVGHSYGSLIALRYAIEHPARVRRLVLVETPLPPHRLAETEELIPIVGAELAAVAKPEELRTRILNHEQVEAILDILPPPLKAVIQGGRRGFQRIARDLWFLIGESTLVRDLRTEPDIPDGRLARIACPTLCIFGRSSKLRPIGARLTAVLPNATLVELDGGHYLVNERPRELSQAIADFLRP
jgi:pimeloyl-ACP methyl ester carboxylesterase